MLPSTMAEARTQEPSPRKLRRARREGRVPFSRELTAVGVLLAALVVAWWGSGVLLERLGQCFRLSFRAVRVQGDPQVLLESCTRLTLGPLTAGAAALWAVAMVVGGVQVGPLWSLRAVAPRWRGGSRGGLWASGARSRAVPGMKLLVQLACLLTLAAWVLREHAASLARMSLARPSALLQAWGHLLVELWAGSVAGLAVLAVLDLLYQHYRHRVDLRMSRSELRREQREEAGDPRSRARRQRLHGELIRSAGNKPGS